MVRPVIAYPCSRGCSQHLCIHGQYQLDPRGYFRRGKKRKWERVMEGGEYPGVVEERKKGWCIISRNTVFICEIKNNERQKELNLLMLCTNLASRNMPSLYYFLMSLCQAFYYILNTQVQLHGHSETSSLVGGNKHQWNLNTVSIQVVNVRICGPHQGSIVHFSLALFVFITPLMIYIVRLLEFYKPSFALQPYKIKSGPSRQLQG